MTTRDYNDPSFPGIPLTLPETTTLITIAHEGRELLSIHRDGTVTGEIEDMGEAARVFVESLRLILGGKPISLIEAVNKPDRIEKLLGE